MYQKTAYLGKAATVRRWTKTALECRERGCNCKGCLLNIFFRSINQKCQMKAAVLELERVLGRHPDYAGPTILKENAKKIQII